MDDTFEKALAVLSCIIFRLIDIEPDKKNLLKITGLE